MNTYNCLRETPDYIHKILDIIARGDKLPPVQWIDTDNLRLFRWGNKQVVTSTAAWDDIYNKVLEIESF